MIVFMAHQPRCLASRAELAVRETRGAVATQSRVQRCTKGQLSGGPVTQSLAPITHETGHTTRPDRQPTMELPMRIPRSPLSWTVLILASLALIQGCVSKPDLRADYDKSADFAKYHTF